jgi:hypothetical protein
MWFLAWKVGSVDLFACAVSEVSLISTVRDPARDCLFFHAGGAQSPTLIL